MLQAEHDALRSLIDAVPGGKASLESVTTAEWTAHARPADGTSVS